MPSRANRERRIFWLKKAGLFSLVGGIILFFGFTIFAAWISRDLPDPNTLLTRDVAQSTKIFDRTGKVLLYEIHGDEKRTLVQISTLPTYVPHATVAIEDKHFYEHHGVSWSGLFRAIVVNTFRGQKIQGTSTLTQQFVKNAVLTNERSILRKLKEVILALQMERVYTKDQILQLYLNEIPYGSNIYGIESASQAYFGKPSKELTLDEAAFLAAIPQAPDYYNPYGTGAHGDNRDALVGRQKYVLTQMAEQGYVTKEEADAAKKEDTLKKLQPRKIGDIRAPHFVMYVRDLLIEAYGQKMVEQGGLNVVTTLDWEKQQAAEDEVTKGVEARGKQYGFSDAALVSLDPKNGQILAMVGSKDFFDDAIDGQVNVTLRPRQPGSSFKPIVYAAGFIRGYLPETQLWDVNTTFKTDTVPYEPKDYDLGERGPVSVRMALQGSLNIPAVKMLYLVGVSRVLDFAESLGYTTFGTRSRFGLSLVLGGGEVTPLEHAAAYAAFANEGVSQPTSAILNVTDAQGKSLQEWKPADGTRVMDAQIARLISNVLSDNDARTYIFGASNYLTLPDRPVAAKTGTTNNYHDAWTAGYTPNLTTVVWVGNADNKEMKRGADGSIVAAPIWKGYMRRATSAMPVESFTPPAPPKTSKPALLGQVVKQMVQVDKTTGKRATAFTPPELITEVPSYEAHSILYYVDKDDPLGPAPTNPADDPQYANWEKAVQDWVTRTGWHATDTVPIVYDDVHTADSQPSVTIQDPQANAAVTSRDLTVQVAAVGSRPIARFEVRLDGELIGSSSGGNPRFTVHIPNRIAKGFYPLAVSAIDDAGNHGEASLTINLVADAGSQAGPIILAPPSGTIWSRSTFPKSTDIDLVDATLYTKVDVGFVGSDGVLRVVGSVTQPTDAQLHFSIPVGPPAGSYRLMVVGTKPDTSADQVDVPITIVE